MVARVQHDDPALCDESVPVCGGEKRDELHEWIVAPRSYTIQNLWLGSLLRDSMEAINTLIDALRTANHDARTDIKAEIIALAKGDDGSAVREHLENLKRGELLEIQWEIDDVLDESAAARRAAVCRA